MKIDKFETNINENKLLDKQEIIKTTDDTKNISDNIIHVDTSTKYQEFLGFGGALTESTCYVLSTINEDIKNEILNEYYNSESGINYNFTRLSIGSCDFSLNSYSYSYEDSLSDFSISRDIKYVIPTIKDALKINKDITFLSSPWSPPAFMKDNKRLTRGGKLKVEYRKKWSEYLVKYINSYKEQGINIKYMTIQNEPNVSQIWESCRYTAEDEAILLKDYIYPTFKDNNIDTKVLIWDHNKDDIVNRVSDTLIKYGALDYASGIAFHWYTGSYFENLNTINKMFPDKLLIHTEGCTGYSKFKPKHELNNAELYASEIIGDLNNGTNAFIDWNLVLDYKGGPNHKRNYCNSPIMINKKKDGYIKTPSFYYIAHFSKFIKPGAIRININDSNNNTNNNIQTTAFINKDNSIVVVLFNKTDNDLKYTLELNNTNNKENNRFTDNINKHSIITLVIK